MRIALFVILIAIPLVAQAVGAQVLRPTDTLNVRLLDAVSSNASSSGTHIRAKLMAPLKRDGHIILPARSMFAGTVMATGKEKSGGERRYLQLHFTSLEIGDGLSIDIDARTVSVENSRESVDQEGRILGPAEASLIKSKEDWAAVALGALTPVGGAVLFAATRGEGNERHRRIAFSAGTDLSVQVRADVSLPVINPTPDLDSVASAPALDDLLSKLPVRAVALAGRIPGDFVNVIFIGTNADIKSAFTTAGWDAPGKMGTRSDFDTFISAAKGVGYAHEPVSQQLMFGRPPDLVFQHVTDTFAKRHHVRLWRTDQTFNGRPVWVAPATHDIGVEFSTVRHSFTHRTDADIDREREKIVNDLLTTMAIAQLSYVKRSRAPAPDAVGGVVSDWNVVIIGLRNAN